MTHPTEKTRVCLCGTEIPPYSAFKNGTDFEPICRHCERVKMTYMDRELSESEPEWIGERRCESCGWTEPELDHNDDAVCSECGRNYPIGTDERTRRRND